MTEKTSPVYWRLDLTEEEFVALHELLDKGEEYVSLDACAALNDVYQRVEKTYRDHRGPRT